MRLRRPLATAGLITAVLALLLAAAAAVGPASAGAYTTQYCSAVPAYTGSGVPKGSGIPPWGFHTGQPISGPTGSYARGWGDINLNKSWINGKVCQADRVRNQPDRVIVMRPESHILYHTHHSMKWGHPGNLIKVKVRVISSTDKRCAVGAVGTMVMYASYNGVRSDSIQFSFGARCSDHGHLYHGPQVDAQVPPL